MTEPESRFFTSFGLRLHYAVWGDESKPPLVLVHGKGDHARSWDPIADALVDHFAVYAPDLRGHGDSDWATGGGYLMADYVADLSRLIQAMDRGPVDVISHSLGGRIAPFYAAAFPECVRRLITIEGFGGFVAPGTTTQRLRTYAEDALKTEARPKRAYQTVDEATARMAVEHPDLGPDRLDSLSRHAVRRRPDRSYVWKFDEFVRMQPFYDSGLEDSRDVWEAVRAPMLIVAGSIGWERMKPARKQLLEGLQNSQISVVPDAGHWVHHAQPEAFMKLVKEFFCLD